VQNTDPGAFQNIQIDNELGREITNGGGGGGGYVPPIITDTVGSFKIYLTSTEDAEYFDGNSSLGSGISQIAEYNPSTTFGSQRTYTSKIDNKVAKNYFVVFLNREFRGYNAQTGQPTYYESIRASEYRLKPGSQTEYEFYAYKNLAGVTGTMELPFIFEAKAIIPTDDIIIIPTKNYEFTINVNSNYLVELEDKFSVHYRIVNVNANIITGSIPFSNPGTDKISLSEEIVNNSQLVLSLTGELPQYFSFDNIKVGTNSNVDRTLTLDASIIKRGNVNVELLFSKNVPQPVVNTIDTQYNGQVKDSDSDKVIEIPFTTNNANSVNVTFPNGNVKNITAQSFAVSFKNDLGGSFDLQKLILTPVFDNILGASKEVFVKFARINNTPDILSVSFPASIDIPAFSDYNIEYEVKYEASSATYVKVELLQKDNTKVVYLDKLEPIGSFKVNVKSLKEKFQNWQGNISFIFTAINNGGDVTLNSNTMIINF